MSGCLDCQDEGLTCQACLADREADDGYRYGCDGAGDVDELDDDDDELVAGDGFQTCEVCAAELSAQESRNLGLGPGLCEACQADTCPRCGCSDFDACEGGCHWLFIDVDGRAVCSACATDEEAAWAADEVAAGGQGGAECGG